MIFLDDGFVNFYNSLLLGCGILLVFRFFIPYHPLWRHKNASVKIEDILSYNYRHRGYLPERTHYILIVNIDGQKRYVAGDENDSIGEKIDVMYSQGMIFKKPASFLDPKALIVTLILAALFFRSFLFVMQNYCAAYFIVLGLLFLASPLIFKMHYSLKIRSGLYKMETGERLRDAMVRPGYDLFHGNKKADTILGIVLGVILLAGIITFIVSLRMIG